MRDIIEISDFIGGGKMKNFQREDYVYFRLLEDFEGENGIVIPKGDVLRYKRERLIQDIQGRQFGEVFDAYSELDYEFNDQCLEDDILYHKIYRSITVLKDVKCRLYLWPEDYFCLNDWLFEHIDERGISAIMNSKKQFIADKENHNQLIQLYEGCPRKELHVNIHFKKGETLDFQNPAVFTLFYDMKWMKFLARTEVITGEEKERLFQEDFSNAIYAQDNITASVFEDDPEHDLHEFHYFKVHDSILAKTRKELSDLVQIDLPYFLEYLYDREGFIKYVYTDTSDLSSSSRIVEQIVLEFADRISVEEARLCHQKMIDAYLEKQRIESLRLEEKMRQENEQLQKLYEEKKNDPCYFPGKNGCFVHYEKDSIHEEAYSLNQIKEFYQNLKTLDPSVVQEMCFYGGTVPYILNHETNSRDFGDIDIFMPVSSMEKLREEFSRQDSFEMISDSKPYAAACHLTSRIEKESTEVMNRKERVGKFMNLMIDSMINPVDDDNVLEIDEMGNCCDSNPFHAFFAEGRSYYNKIQDFGFKAKLFGVDISVFPMYQYKNDIMAKSFNFRDDARFLLGIRLINHMEISDFVRNVQVYDSACRVLPFEYTVVSKKSAVDGNYSYRFSKDQEDVSYILSHQEELGFDSKYLQQIKENYPDYSISVAYLLHDSGKVSTVGGETYKQYVLTNRHIS